MVEKRHSRLQAPGHRHVVHPLDRVVDQHDLGVEAQCLVDRALCAGGGEVTLYEVAAEVVTDEPGGDRFGKLRVVSVEEHVCIVVNRRAAVDQWRIPVITGEHLVRTLAALHHFDVLRHPL